MGRPLYKDSTYGKAIIQGRAKYQSGPGHYSIMILGARQYFAFLTRAKWIGDRVIYSILTNQYFVALGPLVFRFWGPLVFLPVFCSQGSLVFCALGPLVFCLLGSASILRLGPASILRLGPASILRLGPASILRLGPASILRLGLASILHFGLASISWVLIATEGPWGNQHCRSQDNFFIPKRLMRINGGVC